MTTNVMEEYIKITKEELIELMKIVFEKSYDKSIATRFIDCYIDIRFYNFYERDEQLSFRKNFLNALKEEENRLLKEFPEKRKVIENTGLINYYLLYFDKMSKRTNIKDNIEKLHKIRKKYLLKDNEDFKQTFYNTLLNYTKIKEDFIKKFETNKFFLKFTSYENIKNVYRVNIRYNIKFPSIYSMQAIENAFNRGLIQEDKLFVEYYLLAIHVIEDIIKANFKKQNIAEFDVKLLKKQNKLKSLLNIINNPAIQDKINLKITYSEFCNNKEEIYNLMRNGYRFAVILDETFTPDYINIEKLQVFNFIIASKELRNYEKISAENLKNFITI